MKQGKKTSMWTILALLALLVPVTSALADVTTIDFENLPLNFNYWYSHQNIGTHYPDIEFGPDTVILDSIIGGYNHIGYPPHSGNAVCRPYMTDHITVTFQNEVNFVELWYTCTTIFYLEAYDSADNLLASVTGPSNYGTHSKLSVTTPNIAYVICHNGGSYFTIDDLSYGTSDLDITPPVVNLFNPLQDEIAVGQMQMTCEAQDENNVTAASFTVRQHDGTPIGMEKMAAAYNTETGLWQYDFDCLQLPDGDYQAFANATDEYNNEGVSETVFFTVDNWVECASVQISPSSITRSGCQQNIVAKFVLPEGIQKADIDETAAVILEPGMKPAKLQWVLDAGGSYQTMIFAFFDKQDITDAIPADGVHELKLHGKLMNGQHFYGTGTIRILSTYTSWRR